jgi:Tfp pilus assembly protein PilX
MMMNARTHRRERGAVLGIVVVLLAVILAASAFAMWTMRSDVGGARRDRVARQLFDCAEQGLAAGKNFFATTGRTNWNGYLAANVCASGILPCQPSGPFPTGNTGVAITNYPGGPPYSTTIETNGVLSTFTYTYGIYQNPSSESRTADTDNAVIVYSICADSVTHQTRSVQAYMSSPPAVPNGDYIGQAGHGFRNANNAN